MNELLPDDEGTSDETYLTYSTKGRNATWLRDYYPTNKKTN